MQAGSLRYSLDHTFDLHRTRRALMTPFVSIHANALSSARAAAKANAAARAGWRAVAWRW